ncbi:hypothetical protein [Shewanella psychrotolerans]|uniref:hypothetical protein n=1 Tax=Shewanella psychrotolerans TaxID=2864206 RepID=UPI001C65CC11|nr:hypothetical protein [Shewanella psychrotolerans]QYK03098.1 hypothetical protein K0I62_09355 [Shewanella psychrotolerans]
MLTRMMGYKAAATLAIAFSFTLLGCSKVNEPATEAALSSAETPFSVDKTLCEFGLKACTKTVKGITITLAISPPDTPSERPLDVYLDFTKPVDNLSARVEGRDMFMGIIPMKLAQTAENRYQGKLIYGSCSSNYMVWRMFVSFNVDGKSQTVLFDFLADSDEATR